MTCASVVLSRILMSIIWIGAGVNKLQNTQKMAGFATTSLGYFNTWISKDLQLGDLPMKDIFDQNMLLIIQVIAVVQILGALLLLLGNRFGPFLLILLIVPFTLIVHNPFYSHLKGEKKMNEFNNFFLNWLIFAGLLMAFGYNPRKIAAGNTSLISSDFTYLRSWFVIIQV